ncbi:hypothetical protein [Natronosalvus amylolyticus]|uniref:hypothetical protein n=1 Tax=Natronosalvus amylolyticus TaxID=2961994 RepID=UPI0020C965DC|nr:hypothetical protein [Natronosalvus amylolyticus]
MAAETDIDKDRRRAIAQDALETGFEDPYWLHNLARCLWFQNEAYDDLLETVEQLREDADRLERAYERIEDGELLPAEAALYIAEGVHFGEYHTRQHLYDGLPIGGDGGE